MMPDLLLFIFLTFLLITALAVAFIKELFPAVIIFGIYSLMVSIVWQILGSPDLAITEAAAGIGTSVLLVAVITRIRRECP